MSQESQSIIARLNKANSRERFNPPKDLFYQRFAVTGTLTDNATTAADLTASGSVISQAITDRLGVTVVSTADPTIVFVVERMGLELHLGVETALVAQGLIRACYTKHTPANDRAQTIDLAGYVTSSISPANGVIATGAFGVAQKKADTYDLEVPLVVDMQRDAWTLAPQVAVDSAANVPFTLWIDAWAFHNRGYVRSDFLADLDGDDDQLRVLMGRAKSNATREFRQGKPASVMALGGKK